MYYVPCAILLPQVNNYVPCTILPPQVNNAEFPPRADVSFMLRQTIARGGKVTYSSK